MSAQPRHGVDGWLLQEFILDDLTSTGHYTYSRRLPGCEPEEISVERSIPCASSHKGWRRPDSIEN